MLRKDSSGSVTGIIMPNQAQHTLDYRTYFNGYRLTYAGLHQQIWEYDSKSNLRRIYFPFQRLITYKYDEHDHLVYMFADGCKTSFVNDLSSRIIRMEYVRGQIHEQIYTYHTNGSLEHVIDHYNDHNVYAIVSIHYTSIHSFEVRLLSSKMFNRHLLDNYAAIVRSNYSSQFDTNSGYLQSNSFVRITYPTVIS
jgi:hypothetical protein